MTRSWHLLLSAALSAALCVALPTPSAAQSPGTPDALVWPRPPATAAVGYVRGVEVPADWGIKTSFLGRIIDAIAGKPEERFVRPTGVAEREGVLYVADPGAPALWILDAPANRSLKVQRAGDLALASPVAVALGADGSVFVADSVLKKVFAFDRNGGLLGVAAADLERPAALAYDLARGELYVADTVGHFVGVFGTKGERLRTIGSRGTGDGQLNGPAYLALDRDGHLLVTDAYNFRIVSFDHDGRFRWKMGRAGDGSGDFASPKGVAVDSRGQLYVVDALFDVVQVFGAPGPLLFTFGARGAGAGQFSLPGGIYIGGDTIYVADAYNHRVQVFRRLPGSVQGAAQ